jgi:hypothetical protein
MAVCGETSGAWGLWGVTQCMGGLVRKQSMRSGRTMGDSASELFLLNENISLEIFHHARISCSGKN